MVKVKGDKFLGTDGDGNRRQIFRFWGSNTYLSMNTSLHIDLKDSSLKKVSRMYILFISYSYGVLLFISSILKYE